MYFFKSVGSCTLLILITNARSGKKTKSGRFMGRTEIAIPSLNFEPLRCSHWAPPLVFELTQGVLEMRDYGITGLGQSAEK